MLPRQNSLRTLWLVLLAPLLGIACNGERVEPAASDVLLLDGSTDSGADVGVDTTSDVDALDAAEDLDARLDAAPDITTEADVTSDAGADAAGDVDAAGDIPDAGPEPPTQQVLITEVMADNDATLVLEDGESPDWIELHNPGPDPVSLVGFTLSDDIEAAGATFSSAALVPGAFLVVHADGESLPFRLSADGEEVVLRDSSGALVDHFEFGSMQEDVSAGRGQLSATEVLVDDGDVARFHAGVPDGWREHGSDDSNWAEVVLPIGYDLTRIPSDELALRQETSQSSDGYGLTGVQAVDGDRGSISHTGDADLTPWWQVDLASTAELSEVTLYNRIGCCEERLYNIVVDVLDEDGLPVWSSDTLNPTAEGSWPASPGDSIAVPIDPPTLGRFVRVSKTAVNGSWSTEWLSLGEVVVSGALLGSYAEALQTLLSGPDALDDGRGVVRVELPTPSFDPLVWRLEVWADDGFEAVLAGASVLSHNLDAPVPVEVDAPLVAAVAPVDGATTLAVQLLDADGEDAFLRVRLTALEIETDASSALLFRVPTPGEPNIGGVDGFLAPPVVDPPRGWLDGPTDVTVAAPDGAILVYTLDGSRPTVSNGTVAVSGTLALPVEHTTVLRAIALRDGWAESPAVTHTWLSMDDVVNQPAAPPGVPAIWSGLGQGPVAGNYEMDPEVTDDPAYADDLRAGLRAIPTMSIVMDPEDLWGDDAGIYVHSTQRGAEWERATSMELLEPDGTSFQGDCGIRIHGYGWRPHSNTLKHSFRLEFRSRYGATKLEYPLFPDAPVDRFDSIVLRAQGSRGWQDFRDPEQSQYIRDAFARDTAFAMGKADGHATYVHLFLNGLYWGLYMPVERPDADFAAERFGGDDSEYDAINRRTTTNEAIDGTLEAYNTLLALSDADLSVTENYEAVAELIDLEDLIDYMLIHQYTTNRDGPDYFSHNNMRGTRRRAEGERFRFFVWDMEYSLWYADDHINIDVDVAGSASHVYARLRANAEFRELYAERAAEHLGPGGALSAERALDRYEARAEQIEDAVVAESARWGDTDRATPYTRDAEWAEERRRLVEEYFPRRTDVLIEQLRAAGLMR